MQFVADFETVNDVEDCRVWSWGVCEIDEHPQYFEWGIDIEGFMHWCLCQTKPKIYFHNLKFDASFILYWLFLNGYTYTKDKKHMKDKTFNTLVSDKGQFYQLTICEKAGSKGNKITFYDSLKLLPYKVEQLPKAFGFDHELVKGEIDYNKKREKGYIPNRDELSYQKRDVLIVARSLYYMFQHGMTKMTVGSNALQNYKDLIGERNFKNWFPQLECDSYIRQSYRGGFTWCNPKFAGKCVKTGMVFDVNSLYPWVLHDCLLPYGEPIFYTGDYEEDPVYPLYVARCIIDISLKPEHIPTIQIKQCFRYGSNEYITETKQPEELYLTNVDIELMFQQYDVHEFIMLDGYKFKGSSQLFKPFIDLHMGRKIQADKEGNKVLRTHSKMMQNNLYGKYGLNPNTRSKHPIMDDNGVIKWELGEKEHRDPVYIPVATFVTAYARYKTITTAQKLYARFCYADTDSVHIIETDEPKMIDIDAYRLGAWKKESVFRRALFLRQKTYIEEIFDHKKKRWSLNITCAGMPDRCYKHVSIKNFKPGRSFKGHLKHVNAIGGTVLLDNLFTIKQ